MSSKGYITVDRGVFDHPMFAPEPFSEREAWLWMIAEAAYRPTRVRVGRAYAELQRGQLAYATRFLATRWRWSEARVRRFLARLKNDAMIDALATRDATLITICNYDKYQGDRRAGDTTDDAQNMRRTGDALPFLEATQVSHEDFKENHEERRTDDARVDAQATQRRNQETSKPEDRSSSLRSDDQRERAQSAGSGELLFGEIEPPAAKPLQTARQHGFDVGAFMTFWTAYPHKVGKQDALKAFETVAKSGRVTFGELMNGLGRYQRTKPPDRAWCNPGTWLRQGRWDDEPDHDQAGRAGHSPVQRQLRGGDAVLAGMARVARRLGLDLDDIQGIEEP